MATVRPTKKQRVLLDFIASFIAEHGYSPSYREIVNGCGYNSVATVAVHINNLISRGHLRKRDHSARSLELTANTGADESVLSDGGVATEDKAEAWFVQKIEAKLNAIESASEISADDLYAVQVLMAVLSILDMSVDIKKLANRIEQLERHLRGRVQSDRKAV